MTTFDIHCIRFVYTAGWSECPISCCHWQPCGHCKGTGWRGWTVRDTQDDVSTKEGCYEAAGTAMQYSTELDTLA